MAENGTNSRDVYSSIARHKGLIISISIASAIAGALFYIAGPKKYEAKTEFLLGNPMVGDRTNLYNANDRTFDYFGNEEDVDRIILLSKSDIVQSRVIRGQHLAEAYKIDTTTRKGQMRLERKFDGNLSIMRTEYRAIVLSYVDTDPVRAADVANECVTVLENTYQSIAAKMHEADSTITVLTDTLIKLRDKYGIYDIINPNRYNIMLSGAKTNGHKDFAAGLEAVQNIESLKDQTVSDRAKLTTLLNQYTTGVKNDQLPIVKVITPAKVPVTPKGLGGMLTVLACGLIGCFFGTLILLLRDNYFEKSGKK